MAFGVNRYSNVFLFFQLNAYSDMLHLFGECKVSLLVCEHDRLLKRMWSEI